MKPTKLKSGNYRIQVRINGHRISKTFSDKYDAIAWATSVKTSENSVHKESIITNIEDAIKLYIETKSNILSPTSIASYTRSINSIPEDFRHTPIKNVTLNMYQRYINEMASRLSPKYINSIYNLINKSVRELYPSFDLKPTLPKKVPREMKIPSKEELDSLYELFKGTDMELPFLCGAWLGMRESEICGLQQKCIVGDKLIVKQARVKDVNGNWVLKSPKTYSGYRELFLPDKIKELISKVPKDQEFLVKMNGADVYEKFWRACRKLGIKYRFHDLRHYNASLMIAQGVPEKYIIERLGHVSRNMIDKVYGHVMQDKKREVAEKIDEYFNHQF